MQTWVLILMVWGTSWDKKPNISTIPGYTIVERCRKAGEDLVSEDAAERSKAIILHPVTIEYRCFPGPQ